MPWKCVKISIYTTIILPVVLFDYDIKEGHGSRKIDLSLLYKDYEECGLLGSLQRAGRFGGTCRLQLQS